ncbi:MULTISPECIES: hypothetical protein [Nostoc]|uniref:Uncharacterized protein n=1 Tax=Nostoc paludosum FACHB-159 TaxID=2692908 RepID=A0ABR8KEV7_9NOSO|nr:hypothetical protein [Nostoc sp. FACHB-857]MBD2737369.1 hypothetical protein [Nostoc paludosum FACHB-159]
MTFLPKPISFAAKNQLLLMRSHFRGTSGAIAYKSQTIDLLQKLLKKIRFGVDEAHNCREQQLDKPQTKSFSTISISKRQNFKYLQFPIYMLT